MTCETCGAEQPPGARFCFRCGSALAAAVCASCGAPLVAGWRFCAECGTPVPVPAGADPSSDPSRVRPPSVTARRVTSVLFGDLVSFTTLSEQRDEEDVRELLSRYFAECSRVVARYGGVVEKFIGDAVMAVWGVPTAHEDDAERSVRAGLDLVSDVEALGAELAVPGLRMRVGVVTGEVAVTIGAEQQGMVAGDPVTTASRIQGLASPGEVWVDETTRELTHLAITYREQGEHDLEGRTGPVPLWSARAVIASRRGARRPDGIEAPLVGRDRELRPLKELFHAAEDSGRANLVVVEGDAGIGKSRLAWELEKYLDGLEARIGWLTGRCAAYGEGIAFQPLADAVRGRLRTSVADQEKRADDEAADGDDAALISRVRDFVEDEEERAWLEPRLSVLLGAGSETTFAREDLFAAWATFLERIGRGRQAVVWVVDDAQHADESFLQFLDYLSEAAAFPVLVVLLSRPGLLEAHPWLVTSRRATVLRLSQLGDREMAELVDALVEGLPAAARDTLVGRSDGLPLFAVETVCALAGRDLVSRLDQHYVVTDPGLLDIDSVGAPESLQAVVRARLDGLTRDQRTVVDRASVLGNAFTRDTIGGLCPELADLDVVLTELVRLEILRRDLRRTSPDFGRYRFAQAVTAQVAASILSRRERSSTHLAAAHQLETEDTTGDLAPAIAAHLADAVAAVPDAPDVDDLVRALVSHLERAAERLRSLGAPGEAAGHLRTALEHASDDRSRADLRRQLAWALVDAGRYSEALAPAAEAVREYDAWGDDLAAAEAASAQAQVLITSLGQNAEGLALLEPRWRALQGREDATGVLLAMGSQLTRAELRLGIDPRETLETRLRLADLTGHHEAMSDTLTSLALYYMANGAPTVFTLLQEAAVELSREHHLVRTHARALVNLTANLVARDLDRALAVGLEAVQEARRSGLDLLRDYATLNLGITRFARGDWARLREELTAPEAYDDMSNLPIRVGFALQIDRARGTVGDLPWVRGSRDLIDVDGPRAWQDLSEALVLLDEGDAAGAAALAVQAVDVLHALAGVSEDLVMLWGAASEAVVEAGDVKALDHMLELTSLAWAPEGLVAHQLWARGAMALRTDSAEAAEPLLREAVERYDAWGSPVYAARAAADLAAAHVALGRVSDAAAPLERARTVFESLDATAWLARLVH